MQTESEAYSRFLSFHQDHGHNHRTILESLRGKQGQGTQVTGPALWAAAGTHVEEISERGAEREANLGLEERRGEVHNPPDKFLVSNM